MPEDRIMPRTIDKTADYPHSPERVWMALTDPDALARWLMPNDFLPEVGHRFTFRTKPAPGFDGIVHCEVLEVDEPRTLVYTWTGGPIDTVVRFRLEPTDTGTRLHFQQSGFRGIRARLVGRILASGWGGMFDKRLPALLDEFAHRMG